MWFCPECGSRQEDSFRFCTSCGTKKPDAYNAPEPDPQPVYEPDYDRTVRLDQEQSYEPARAQVKKPVQESYSDRIPKDLQIAGIRVPTLTAVIAAALVLVLIVLLACGVFPSADSLKTKADKAYSGENYKDAYSGYIKYAKKADLSDDQTNRLLADTRLALAREALDDEDWKTAAEYLEYCTGSKAEELKALCNVGLARKAIDSEDWETAGELLEGSDIPEAEEPKAMCNYHFAVEAMNDEDWETAANLLKGLDYLDSAALLKTCEDKLGPDSAFLEALEAGVLQYMSMDKSSISARLAAMMEIQSAIYEFEGQVFYDSVLGDIAAEIIENVNEQVSIGEDAVATRTYYRTYQKYIWEYMLDLCEWIEELNTGYEFLAGNADLQNQFINARETWKSQLDKILAFDKDFKEYRSKYTASGWARTNQQFIKYLNSTGIYYSSITFFFDLYDKNGGYVSTSKTTIDIPKNETIRIVFDCDANKVRSWDWDWFINF